MRDDGISHRRGMTFLFLCLPDELFPTYDNKGAVLIYPTYIVLTPFDIS